MVIFQKRKIQFKFRCKTILISVLLDNQRSMHLLNYINMKFIDKLIYSKGSNYFIDSLAVNADGLS